jgi:hypothetical protein
MTRPARETVTARLMGDPKPNRIEVSDAIRARVSGEFPEDAPPPANVMSVLEALVDGPLTLAQLSIEMDVSLSAGSDRAGRAFKLGLICRSNTRPCTVFLSPQGEALVG